MDELALIPRVELEVDGQLLPPPEARALGAVRIQERLSRPSACELRFFAAEGIAPPTAHFAPGSALRVSLPDRNQELFDGEVTAVELSYEASRGRELRVRAFDRLHRLQKRQPVRTFRGVTLADLAAELCTADGIEIEADEPGPLWDTLVQFRQTDFDLLAEVAARSGVHFSLRGGALRLSARALAGSGEPRPLALGETLLEARVELDGAPACRSVIAHGWDPWLAEQRTGRADSARVGRAIGADAPPERMASSGEWRLVDEAVQQHAQAEAMAQAELDHRVAAEAVLDGVADGDAELHPGSIVEIIGIEAPMAGLYVLTEVAHCIDGKRGFVSEISSRPPELEHRPWGAQASFGVVSSVDDPDGHGRVKVTLPAYEDLESDWLGVVCPGAGPDKGVCALPDVGDRVLVLFVRQDPAQGIVIGGLYGPSTPPDGVIDGGKVRKFAMRTAGGQLLRLDDGAGTIRLENSDGSYLELSPDQLTIRAKVDLDIAAPGRAITIRGKSIDFQSA